MATLFVDGCNLLVYYLLHNNNYKGTPMQLNQYIAQALTTESRIDTVSVDVAQLKNILSTLIAAGNLLDVIKKDTFYGLPTNPEKLQARNDRLKKNATTLWHSACQTAAGVRPTPEVQPLPNVDPRVVHAILGLATESVELLEALYTAIDANKPIDGINILEELGDLNWYHAIAVDALGGDWEQILQTNLNKLARRNKGSTFNAQATINRDPVAERALLEQQLSKLVGPDEC